MINLNKLKGKIAENNRSYSECATAINRSTTTFSAKMNGRGTFSVDEANKLSTYLGLNQQEKLNIFLP